jgi:hypothetical protein
MLEDRNIKYPSYVLALLLGVVALTDAQHGLALMDAGGSAAWFLELLTAGISAALAVLLLMRPHLWFFCAAAIWSLLAFCANFIMKMKQGDTVAIERMTIYWIVLVGACVLIAVEGFKWYQVWSKRPRPMYQYPPQYAPQQMPPQQMPPQYAPPPPPPPAPPAAPRAPRQK